MEAYEGLIQTIALTMGVAWASGINLYATLVALGVMMNMGYVDLPPDLQVVGDHRSRFHVHSRILRR